MYDAKAVARFWSKVDRRGDDECWPWIGIFSSSGYGSFCVRNRRDCAHRVSYILNTGQPVPPRTYICHRCDNPACVNPGHLFAGTPKENVADAIAKNRFHCGERGSAAKLTTARVIELRQLRSEGMTYAALSRRFLISHSQAFRIANHQRWPERAFAADGPEGRQHNGGNDAKS